MPHYHVNLCDTWAASHDPTGRALAAAIRHSQKDEPIMANSPEEAYRRAAVRTAERDFQLELAHGGLFESTLGYNDWGWHAEAVITQDPDFRLVLIVGHDSPLKAEAAEIYELACALLLADYARS